MMKIYINILFTLTTLQAIGFDAVNIFSSPDDLALSGTGVASRNSIYSSPAISKTNYSTLSFSANKWVQNFSGNSFLFFKDRFRLTFNSIGLEDIEVYDETPSESPLDIISSHYLSFGISKGFNIKQFIFGIGANFQYSQLFTKDVSVVTYDIGLKKIFSENLRFGLLAKNLSNSNFNVPSSYTMGCSFYSPRTNTELLIDYNYSSTYNSGTHIGFIQKIKLLTLKSGYSDYNSRTTLSAGLGLDLNKKYSFLYSILYLKDTNLGLSHYFGLELSI